jgi:hypothetical protein
VTDHQSEVIGASKLRWFVPVSVGTSDGYARRSVDIRGTGTALRTTIVPAVGHDTRPV